MSVMQKYFPILLIGIFNIRHCFCTAACKPKVAIIGAGIGGASASYFLTELFEKNVDVDIFESHNVGGRLATVRFGKEEFEAGGAIIHPRNKYMKGFSQMLNLYPRKTSDSRFGIWNGKEFVLKESDWESVTMFKLLYRYGLQPFHLYRYISAILDDFEKIYDLQDRGIGFDNVTSLISAMNTDFIDLLQTSIKDHLSTLGYSSKLIDELVEATLVVNYGQDTNVHAFVADVSIAGAGFDLWAVRGGNKEVPRRLISNNRKVSLIHGTVEKIQRHFTDNEVEYEIFYKEEVKENISSSIYDIVIIAAPMTKDHRTLIKFEGFENLNLKFPGEYQTTFATFVVGNINYSYFGLDEELGGIMSCDPLETKISSIGKLYSVEGVKDNRTNVWKVFSRQKLDDSIMSKIFSKVDEVKEIEWKAYPRYSSSLRLDKFKLDNLMYHVNAIEWAASAMEMSAIGGRNVAILAFNDYQQKCSSSTVNKNAREKTEL